MPESSRTTAVRHRRSRESGRGRHAFLRGRRKSGINFGGIKFFPEEVEQIHDAHPADPRKPVSGEPHERWGAVAVAEFVAHDIARPPTAAVLHCRERLAGYKVPAIPPDRGAAAHAEREAAAMKRAGVRDDPARAQLVDRTRFVIRIISARKANRRESRRYHDYFKTKA